MEMILAVDRDWHIGYKGDMLFYIHEDLARFKEITMGHIMVMGKNTFLSLPGSKPLPGRIHVVFSRDENFKVPGVVVVRSEEEMDAWVEENRKPDQKVFLIGGGSLCNQLLHRINKAHITYVDKAFPNYDTALPNLDQNPEFTITWESEEKTDPSGLEYVYRTYERKRQ